MWIRTRNRPESVLFFHVPPPRALPRDWVLVLGVSREALRSTARLAPIYFATSRVLRKRASVNTARSSSDPDFMACGS